MLSYLLSKYLQYLVDIFFEILDNKPAKKRQFYK